MNLDYQANGTVIGAVETHTAGRFVILVYWNGAYVISQYTKGAVEWISGRYVNELCPALDEFSRVCMIYCG